MAFYQRKPTRIPNYDYSSNNYYFITICTHNKKCIFGQPSQRNDFGEIAYHHISRLGSYYESVYVEKFVVMPNHVHMILVLDCQNRNNPNVSQIIAQYKSGVSREIRKMDSSVEVWQRSFHDHIIRNQKSYEKIWQYIETNPLKWEDDCFYSATSNI